MIQNRLTYANVVATLALILALGGASAFAAGKLAKNSVGTKQIKNNSVTTAKLKNGAVTGAKIAAGAITGDKVNLATLGTVPTAVSATHAVSADNANHANNASNADKLGGIGPSGFSREAHASINDNALVHVSGTAREANINAPQSGFVLAVASSDVFGSTADAMNCAIFFDNNEVESSRRTIDLGTENLEENCETNAIVPVSAGSHNFKFNYSGVGSTTTVDETELDLVFIPLAG